MDTSKQTFPDIPPGPKSNCQFFVDNPNINPDVWQIKKENPKRGRFTNPNCHRGPYEKQNSKTEVYELKDGRLETCELIINETIMKYIDKYTGEVTNVDPERQIFVVRKYYFRKGGYSKHLLYFLEVPDSDLYKDVKNHVFVDFIGQDPGGEGSLWRQGG